MWVLIADHAYAFHPLTFVLIFLLFRKWVIPADYLCFMFWYKFCSSGCECFQITSIDNPHVWHFFYSVVCPQDVSIMWSLIFHALIFFVFYAFQDVSVSKWSFISCSNIDFTFFLQDVSAFIWLNMFHVLRSFCVL
jgi:hypothetical protein